MPHALCPLCPLSFLRPSTVIQIVTCLWVLTSLIVITFATILGFLITWGIGLVIGLVCFPFALIMQGCSDLPQTVAWCCCCWPPLLLMHMVE